MATTGIIPCLARPPAMDTACCSAIPTSKVRSGNFSMNFSSPVPLGMAAVMAQTLESFAASSTIFPPKESEKEITLPLRGLPVSGSNFPMPWNREGSSSAGKYPQPFFVFTQNKIIFFRKTFSSFRQNRII